MKRLILGMLLLASPVFAGPAHAADGPNVMHADIFDWQGLDEAGKLALLGRIKAVWKEKGVNVALDEKALLAKMVLGEQANIFESACVAAGLDPVTLKSAAAPAADGPSVMHADIFDWQGLDEAGKLALLGRIKAAWKEKGVDVALDEKALLAKMVLGEQANIFESACVAAGLDPATLQAAAAPADGPNVMYADIFDWQGLDEAGKLALLGRIKAVWKEKGVNVALDEKALLAKMVLGEQANIFECACQAAGVDPSLFR